MKKAILHIVILLSISCSYNQQKGQVINNDYCENMILLFSPNDSSATVLINDSNLVDFNTNQFIKGTNSNDDHFGLKLKNGFVVKIYYSIARNNCVIQNPGISILLNHEGELALEMNIIPIDSIMFSLYNELQKKKEIKSKKISLFLSNAVPTDSLNKVAINIIEGYTLLYSELANELFHKKICELNLQQINELKKIMPFQIHLKDSTQF